MTVFKPKIIIVDDSEIFRCSLEFHLKITLNYEVIGIAANGEEFLALNNINNADIILMDIEMPVLNGFAAAGKALWKYLNLNIIAITDYQDKAYLKDLIETGFKGCVFKKNLFNEIESAIKNVLNNKLYFPQDIEFNRLQ
jgi:DNA-binding NarL/FixJ family response regulator